jgi:alanine racemase
MDNTTVDLGAGATTRPGAPAVLLGTQGEAEISAEELARGLGTINYEITCGVSPRVPRAYRR